MSNEIEPRFYTLEQLAARWAVNVKWLRRRIYDGQLKAVKMGKLIRVPADQVRTYEASLPAA